MACVAGCGPWATHVPLWSEGCRRPLQPGAGRQDPGIPSISLFLAAPQPVVLFPQLSRLWEEAGRPGPLCACGLVGVCARVCLALLRPRKAGTVSGLGRLFSGDRKGLAEVGAAQGGDQPTNPPQHRDRCLSFTPGWGTETVRGPCPPASAPEPTAKAALPSPNHAGRGEPQAPLPSPSSDPSPRCPLTQVTGFSPSIQTLGALVLTRPGLCIQKCPMEGQASPGPVPHPHELGPSH